MRIKLEPERAAFEHWWRLVTDDPDAPMRRKEETYRSPSIASAWLAWKARAALDRRNHPLEGERT